MSYLQRFSSVRHEADDTNGGRSLGIMFVNKSSLDLIRTEFSTNGEDTEVFQDDTETLTSQRGSSLMLQQRRHERDISCMMTYTLSARRGTWNFWVSAKWYTSDADPHCQVGFTENGFQSDESGGSCFVAVTDEEGRVYTLTCKAKERRRRQEHITLSIHIEEGF